MLAAQCDWADLIQVRITVVSRSSSVCIPCLNFHSVMLLTLAEFVIHCSTSLFTKKIATC